MNNEYKINYEIKYSEVDNKYCLRPDHIMTHFQDITGLHSVEMEIDGKTMLELSNAFWVVTKIKMKIHRMPKFEEKVVIETWPTYAKGVRFGRDYTISNNNEILVSCCSEWCTLDYDTKRPRRVESVHYPHFMPHRLDRSAAGEFIKIKEEICDKDFDHNHKVLFTDIDTNNHANNIAYIRMILDCFTIEEFNSLNIDEVQVSYLLQAFYADEVSVYKKKKEYGFYIEGVSNGQTLFNCIIITKHF